MTDPVALTFDALYLTFTGQAPVEAWFPLFGDILRMIVDALANIIVGVFT